MEKSATKSTETTVNLQESRIQLDCSFDDNEYAEDYSHFEANESKISLRSTVRQTTTADDECTEILRQLQSKQPTHWSNLPDKLHLIFTIF